MAVAFTYGDDVLRRYHNQIAVIGEGRARPALARALNRVTTMARTRVVREIARSSSIKRSIVTRAVRQRGASHTGSGPLESVIFATGRPISLKHFAARQLSYGVRAKVFGKWQRFPGAFMGPRPGTIAPSLNGHVFVRTTRARLPIEMLYGPSVPQELTRAAARQAFESVIASHLPLRVSHELGRLLPT